MPRQLHRRLRVRTLRTLLILLTVTAWPSHADAQSFRALGGLAGWVRAQQVITGEEPTPTRDGLLGGVFIDVGTPRGWLDVLAEAAVVQRGGIVPIGDLDAEAEADYIAFALLPKLRAGVGPLSLYAYGGPLLEFHVRTRAAGELADVYRRSSPQVFGVSAGGGIELNLGPVHSFRLEVRHDEGLSNAFPDAPATVRHRSQAIVLRYGRRGPA